MDKPQQQTVRGMLRVLLNPLKKRGYSLNFLTASEFKCGVMARLRLTIPGPSEIRAFISYPDYVVAYHVWIGPCKNDEDLIVLDYHYKYGTPPPTNTYDGVVVLVQPIGIGNNNLFKRNANITIKDLGDISNPKCDLSLIPEIIIQHSSKQLDKYSQGLQDAAAKATELSKLLEG